MPTKKGSSSSKKRRYKDLPRRPHCAYNIFFKEEKERWLQANERGVVTEERGSRFVAMTRAICMRWKELRADEKEPYEEKAAEDRKRYAVELQEYREKQLVAAHAARGGPLPAVSADHNHEAEDDDECDAEDHHPSQPTSSNEGILAAASATTMMDKDHVRKKPAASDQADTKVENPLTNTVGEAGYLASTNGNTSSLLSNNVLSRGRQPTAFEARLLQQAQGSLAEGPSAASALGTARIMEGNAPPRAGSIPPRQGLIQQSSSHQLGPSLLEEARNNYLASVVASGGSSGLGHQHGEQANAELSRIQQAHQDLHQASKVQSLAASSSGGALLSSSTLHPAQQRLLLLQQSDDPASFSSPAAFGSLQQQLLLQQEQQRKQQRSLVFENNNTSRRLGGGTGQTAAGGLTQLQDLMRQQQRVSEQLQMQQQVQDHLRLQQQLQRSSSQWNAQQQQQLLIHHQLVQQQDEARRLRQLEEIESRLQQQLPNSGNSTFLQHLQQQHNQGPIPTLLSGTTAQPPSSEADLLVLRRMMNSFPPPPG